MNDLKDFGFSFDMPDSVGNNVNNGFSFNGTETEPPSMTFDFTEKEDKTLNPDFKFQVNEDKTEEVTEVEEKEDNSLDFILDESNNSEESEAIEAKQVEKKRRMNLTEIQDYYAKNGGGLNPTNNLDRPTETNPANVIKEGQNSYLVLPDLHLWYKNIRARKDYVDEMSGYLKEIFMIIYTNEHINNVILAGDVFHQSFNSLDNTSLFKNYFYELKKLLNSRGGDIYSVIGNHEYTYNANNLFWHLVDNTIKTPVFIEDHGVKIVLDSYPSKKSTRYFLPYIDGDICITHTEVLPPELKQQVQNETNRRIYTSDRCLSFDRFRVKHLFIGHMHKVVERYVVNAEDIGGQNYKMYAQYLGSIGRTAVDEIDNEFLERDLPLITITGEGTYKVEQFIISLKPFDATVVRSEVEQNKVIYEKRKEFANLKLERVQEKPIDSIKEKYQNDLINQILDAAKVYQQPDAYNYIIAKLNKAYSDYR